MRIPEKLISIPLTVYGTSINILPFSASFSMLYPGAGSFDILAILAKRSKQFPTAISKAYPNILYRFAEYAIIWVFPPLTYKTVGCFIPVANLPI